MVKSELIYIYTLSFPHLTKPPYLPVSRTKLLSHSPLESSHEEIKGTCLASERTVKTTGGKQDQVGVKKGQASHEVSFFPLKHLGTYLDA